MDTTHLSDSFRLQMCPVQDKFPWSLLDTTLQCAKLVMMLSTELHEGYKFGGMQACIGARLEARSDLGHDLCCTYPCNGLVLRLLPPLT